MAVVFITSGARRIGRHLALTAAQRGYDVGFTYHTSTDEAQATIADLEAIGVRVRAVSTDVAKEDLLTSAFDDVVAHLGPPTVVISNTGVFAPANAHATASDVRGAVDVNTLPLITLARCMERQPADGVRRLIAMSSLGSMEIWKDRLAYNVSKSALNTAVRSLARTLAPHITVNAVAPGAIRQPEDVRESDAGLVPTERIPMARYGSAQDIADAVWFFATSTSYITGQILSVDGGYGLVR